MSELLGVDISTGVNVSSREVAVRVIDGVDGINKVVKLRLFFARPALSFGKYFDVGGLDQRL